MVAALAEDTKGRASALLQAKVRAVSITFASKLPIVGTYIATRCATEPPSLIKSTTGNNVTLPGDVIATSTVTSLAEDTKDRASALVQANVRAVSITFISNLPIVGPYIATRYATEPPSITEATPLLGVLRDPKGFATQQAEGILRRLLAPLLDRLPDVDALDNKSADHGLLFKTLVECYVLAKDGGGWLFTHVQEHSLLIAPTVSLGHLSTNDLAASTIGTAVASVTGYSVIQGFISALDKLLATAPNRRVARMWCARAALITGIALVPITNLWTVQSAALLSKLDQTPAVAAAASQYLTVAAAGMPGYAMGEIAKRYLTSQGLSNVHTCILSATAPLNMLLNYLLVDGPIPALRLGFAGAPLSTALSHNAIAGMMVVYIVQRAVHEKADYVLGHHHAVDEEAISVNGESNSGSPTSAIDSPGSSQYQSVMSFFDGMGELASAGISGVLKSASQLWSKDLGGHILRLGPNALATQAVLLATATTLYQAPKAISSASSDRMKKWVTKGDVQRAKIAACVAFVGTLGGVIVIRNILIASASSWGALFNNDLVIVQSVSTVLPTIAIYQAVHGLGAWVDASLAAMGKSTVFPALIASADCFLGIPLGLYLAFSRHWGLVGLWVGLIISLAYSFLVATIVLVTTSWKIAGGQKGTASEGEEDQVSR
ncbi:hypothetical protein PAXRUDRAFT_763139 [Paxillus rubicundulus Ve08.2h10]|uniref:Multidrug and toxic compound extrusion protein n=1 Tax=Paxillus rubicundulus Ve08.2h10 TaxID=930991 RepID=A0A0D0E7F7_9AGAM|nr:hypothetical protein PAXRUDRAFT_763139 [Paxillus rubicundulus Ve08.2h10]